MKKSTKSGRKETTFDLRQDRPNSGLNIEGRKHSADRLAERRPENIDRKNRVSADQPDFLLNLWSPHLGEALKNNL